MELNFKLIESDLKKEFPLSSIYIFDHLCSTEGFQKLIKILETKNIKGIVFGGCTPQIIEMKLKLELKKYNLQNILFEVANIREQCAWVHESNKATYKATILIKSHIDKLFTKEYKTNEVKELEKKLVIIGGGIAGLQIAKNLQDLGYEITIIEKENYLGGFINKLPFIHPYNTSGKDFIEKIVKSLNFQKIRILTNWNVEWIIGNLGNYTVKIVEHDNKLNEKTLNASVLVLATGHDIFRPKLNDFYKYDEEKNVITLSELGEFFNFLKNHNINNADKDLMKIFSDNKLKKRILIVQCVGSRNKKYYDYCSKYCCITAINYSIEILNNFPKFEITILYIDIRTPWKAEYDYQKARSLGINFIRGELGKIEKIQNKLSVTIYDSLLQKVLIIHPDLIVLSTAIIPNKENIKLLNQINIKTWNKGFIQGKYPKQNNIETSRNGIFACGTVLGPKLIDETLKEANSVSMEIIKLFEFPEIFNTQNFTIVDPELCNGCELCVRICPFSVPYMVQKENETSTDVRYLALIDPYSCRGCGVCNAVCPTGAAKLNNYSPKEIFAQIESILKDSHTFEKPIILGFVCNECAYASVDMLGLLRKSYSDNIRLIRLPCGGRLSLLDILKCFNEGANGVFLIACDEGKCHYIDGNSKAKMQIEAAKEILEAIGWEKNRIEFFTSFAADNNKLYLKIKDFVKRINEFDKLPKFKLKN